MVDIVGHIIAIGGGESGWMGSPYETFVFDSTAVSLTGKQHPLMVFIGFAAADPLLYYNLIKDNYKKIGCKTSHLSIAECEKGNAQDILEQANIIYIAGGDTVKLMFCIHKYNLSVALKHFFEMPGHVIVGISAGANCMCKYGNSKYKADDQTVYVRHVEGIGLLNVYFCPHILRDPFRLEPMKNKLMKIPGLTGIAMDYSALVTDGYQYSLLYIDDRSIAKKIMYCNGRMVEENLMCLKGGSWNGLLGCHE